MASSAFPKMDMPPATGEQNLNYLSLPNIASEFETSLRAFVQTVRPNDLGIEFPWDDMGRSILPSVYATKAMNFLLSKPYMLKELVGTKKVMYSDLSKSDRQWVRAKLVELFKAQRSASDYNEFSSRIVPDTAYNWIEFRTVDCVFAAVIHELSAQTTLRVNRTTLPSALPETAKDARIKTAEASEEALEKWLADYLSLPRTVMEDTRLIYVMENDLGFKNIAAIRIYNDLKGDAYRGGRYVVSYERTAGTTTRSAFWHTVHVSTEASTPVITDRQAPALGQVASIKTDAPCDVWQINRDNPKFQKLIEAFGNRT